MVCNILYNLSVVLRWCLKGIGFAKLQCARLPAQYEFMKLWVVGRQHSAMFKLGHRSASGARHMAAMNWHSTWSLTRGQCWWWKAADQSFVAVPKTWLRPCRCPAASHSHKPQMQCSWIGGEPVAGQWCICTVHTDKLLECHQWADATGILCRELYYATRLYSDKYLCVINQ